MISRSKYRSSVEICADCGASDPSWASINRGLLLCAECCSIHRSMGRHISHVKSLRQGTWPPSLLAMVHAATAQNVNSIWEHSLLDTSAPKHLRKKPQPKDPLHPTKSEFILSKHLRLAYVLKARRDEPPAELGRQLHSAVRSFSLDTAMRLLAQGADPNYYNQEKGSSCLHVACGAGQRAQAELLAAWGAAPAARDRAGRTPADTARLGGHTELASRMSELVYEATDRMISFLSGARAEGGAGAGAGAAGAGGRGQLPHEMTDVAKAARGKLQLLPNHLFEELVMDIYDEIDRRETEAIWQTSCAGTSLERSGVAFLPVNPALSAPRNQGRQKLARLAIGELMALLRDVLGDASRRQHVASLQPRELPGRGPPAGSDDEPLYDSVASDDDCADHDMPNQVPRPGETVSSTYNPSLPGEHTQPPEQDKVQLETLQKELDSRDSTINDLKNQLKNLQTIVEQLTKENSVLKTTSSADDDHSIMSQNSISLLDSTASNVTDKPERGKSLETENLVRSEDEVKMKSQRPVSMYETREGPRSNWQVTKHQLTTVTSLDRSLTASVLGEEPPAPPSPPAPPAPPASAVHRRAEDVTRAIAELWSAAREQPAATLRARAADLRAAVGRLLALFPERSSDLELEEVLSELRSACSQVWTACGGDALGGTQAAGGGLGGLDEVRAAAYHLARATKLLVTHYPEDTS